MNTLNRRSPVRFAAVAAPVLALALTGCSSPAGGERDAAAPDEHASETEVSAPRVVVSYDGGLLVLEGDSLEPVDEMPLDGFLRLNPAGDARHVMVSTDDAFRVLDTGVTIEAHGDHAHYYAGAPELTDIEFAAEHPGHVTTHAGTTALFADGTGRVELFAPATLGGGRPESTTYESPAEHHGVAVALDDGGLLTTLGTSETRTGAVVLDSSHTEIARTEDCPGVHGETVAADEVIVIGCENGVVLYADGVFTKVASPDAYGRIGNQAGSPESAIVLGDYKVDAEAEIERPQRVSLVDTDTATLRLVELGTSYTFRSLARGPHGEALVLGTDGAIHVIDPVAGVVSSRIDVIAPWTEPVDWQEPRPSLEVRGHRAYVTDSSTSTVHVVDLESGQITASAELPHVPIELSTVGD
ncbi:zinc metallochaperone AztD [Agromyces laixinhei]|uniref:zinc metallochaperone AztD n=1 Tax=Agromyces laixinhei TaxID=2585717 RepID=UPI0012ED221F|nr:zinc metallochaperone AztD [Agromyces laixinhei]